MEFAAAAPALSVEAPVTPAPKPELTATLEPPAEARAAAIPGLEYLYLEEKKGKIPEPMRPVLAREAAPPSKAEPLVLEPLEPLEPLEMSADSFGIQKGSSGRVELTPRAEAGGAFERFGAPPEIRAAAPGADAAMFEKRGGEDAGPGSPLTASEPSGELTIGEFLKMFPDAKPD